MLSKSNTFIGIRIFSSKSQHFVCYLYNYLKTHIWRKKNLMWYRLLFKARFLCELPLDSKWVTLISSKYFLIENISFSHIFSSQWTQGHLEECSHLFLQPYFNSETVFFFVLSLVTEFDFAFLRKLQNTWLGVFSHGLVHHLWYCFLILET